MILFKKSYAEQLLQLALTLSLLRVHPNNYLGYNWQSQLTLNNGEGLQLELRPEPVSDFPYANRKAIIPLMEDLVRFDRYRYSTPHDIQTYLLNVQNEQANGDASQPSNQNNETTIHQEGRGQQEQFSALNTNELDLFLNSEHFVEETPSIAEQNAADLNDYGDMFAAFPYAGLPLKDEPPPIYGEIKIEPTTSYTTSDFGSMNNATSDGDDSAYMAVIDWTDFYDFKAEVKTEDSVDDGKQESNGAGDKVKKEADEDESQIDERSEGTQDEKNSTSGFSSNVELTEEESEIVEVLWKQDVDLGYSLAPPKPLDVKKSGVNADDENEKLRALQELKDEKAQEKEKEIDEWDGIQFTIDNETGEYIQLPLQLEEILQDALQLADLTSDDQNDTFSPKVDESASSDNASPDKETGTTDATISDIDISADLSNINLDDASELEELEMMIQSSSPFQHSRSGQNYGHGANSFRQSYHHQSRVPLSRNFSMEQRLQDIASLFNPIPGMGVGMGPADMASYSHYPSHYSYQSSAPLPQHGQFSHPHPHSHAVLHNASLAELGASQPHYGPNLGTAVSSSMHITNSSHDADAGAAGYKIDHDNMMYYSNTSSDINQPTDVFINSILNDEDLHLMDMGVNVNESFYTMRMLETNSSSNNSSVLGASNGANNGLLPSSMHTNISTLGAMGSTGDRLDASSDSAVSSMGSERVPSLSDGEWGDAGSDSAQDFHQSKYGGPYDYSYSSRLSDAARHPVAQKKHQMFGKRYFQEQSSVPSLPQASTHQSDIPLKYEYEPYGMHHGPTLPHNIDSGAGGPLVNKHQPSHMNQPEMKYSCSLDFVRQNRVNDLVNHNHTYTLPQGTGASPRPQARDKKQRRLDEEHLSRDEKRARSLNVSIPMAVQEIINLPMDEFNERLSKYDLSETQLSLIRDIRRRGKNKVAAQNCRKRKLDQIICLADEVKEVRKRKDRLYRDREAALSAHENIKRKFAALHKHVFQNLRDPEGNPYSPTAYSLQQSADGSIFLLPKDNKDSRNNQTNPSNHHQHHPHHQKD
ncbi:segmentation protein cap'n'collar isoform X4 [Bradysia coprophila]|uniref:segmentation protein cap'n'collar isoform X4 n=1 Tax=Bradysia coprophila TaxID=38358 RepID=UPI00187DD3BB|nr:segmentation protein cap'n'collar isoform X4 [Bradysia coprophila]